MEQAVMTNEELRKMQLIQLDMLVEFDRVCRKYNIKYILDAGTLLGAIRYKKFIPWDDDIDIRMTRSEYKKFCDVASELDKTIFFQNNKTDKYYPWIYSKLRKNGTKAVRVGQEHLRMHNGVFIDMFICDGVPENKILCTVRNKIALVCRKILYSRVAKYSAKTRRERVFWTLISAIPKEVSYFFVNILSKIFNEKNCNKLGCVGWHEAPDNNGFKKEWFIEVTEVDFENKKFLASKDWDGFLKHSFGEDYMIPPPIEKRKVCSPLSSYSFGDE